jgi:gluconate 5-dehydrogenase
VAADNPFDLTGLRALVTGGGSGLGLAIARGFARAGAEVVLNGRNVNKLAQRSGPWPRTACGRASHLSTSPTRTALPCPSPTSSSRLGPVDILVNNAAMNQRKNLEEFTPDEWRS